MVFEPALCALPWATPSRFVPVDKGHSPCRCQVWPKDVAEVKGKMNTEFVVTVDKEGIYGFKCTPHYAMGMVAMVQVGAAAVT